MFVGTGPDQCYGDMKRVLGRFLPWLNFAMTSRHQCTVLVIACRHFSFRALFIFSATLCGYALYRLTQIVNRLFKWTEPSVGNSEMDPQGSSLADMQSNLLPPNPMPAHRVDSSSLAADLFPPSESAIAAPPHSSRNVTAAGGGCPSSVRSRDTIRPEAQAAGHQPTFFRIAHLIYSSGGTNVALAFLCVVVWR